MEPAKIRPLAVVKEDALHTPAPATVPDHRDMAAAYRRTIRRRVLILLVMLVVGIAAFALDISTGPSPLALRDVWSGLFDPGSLTPPEVTIIRDVRLPYALMAILVGVSLSLAGAEMQTILNNPLASPFTLGVSSAASFGAALAIVLGLSLPFVPGDWMVPINAFICAFASVLLLEALARSRAAGVEGVVLFGIALVFTFNALVALIQFVASQEALSQLVFWSMGSLGRATWTNLAVLGLVVLVVLPFSMRAANAMTALRLGEDRARSFGIDVQKLRFASLLRISALAATSVAFVGTIGFIGLVGPHIARMLLGEDHRFLLPASMLTGAVIMSLASVASKIMVPGVLLPVGIVTSMIGVPVFLALILRRPDRA
ncbi:FecCD family ABC transporter permease [Croceibacterium xixiisoli]